MVRRFCNHPCMVANLVKRLHELQDAFLALEQQRMMQHDERPIGLGCIGQISRRAARAAVNRRQRRNPTSTAIPSARIASTNCSRVNPSKPAG